MELLRDNFANTTTQFTVSDNTATIEDILTRSTRFQYFTSQFANDNTTASIKISFDETLTIDRIALVGHNLKDFTLFYDGSTANTFNLTATANTSTSDYNANSDTSHFFRFPAVDATSVSIDMKSTIVANENKVVGYLVISEKLTDFDGRVPNARGYKPTFDTQAVVHRLSDGSTRIQTLDDNWDADLSFSFITTAVRDELKEIFDDHNELVFAPFGTTTGWDGTIFPCVWEGSFDFFRYSDNASDAGFSGRIRLKETPT